MRWFRDFLKTDIAGGVLLFAAALFAIVLNNSPLASIYEKLLITNFAITFGEFSLGKPVLFWINDGLMTIFFLLVGLEIKRERLVGSLQHPSRIILPFSGALGGLLVPIVVFYFFNQHDSTALKGLAIPAATDIAFSLGILTLLGKRIPTELKIFLMSLAILDDIAAILIIAIFYTSGLSFVSLAFAFVAIIGLYVINRMGIKELSPYILLGIILWISVLQSGVHATLAGIVLAFAIPLGNVKHKHVSPLVTLEEKLFPWVTFLVLPVFAFANTGFSFSGLTIASLTNNLTLGILLGLFIGKQVGIFGTSWLLVKLRIAELPTNVNWSRLYGVALICGVGFTMSLFIGGLAFKGADPDYARLVRMGVLLGSLVSGVCGYLVLRSACKGYVETNPKEFHS